MAKTAISLTLDQANLLWLKGRARVLAGGSLSAAVDQLITAARAGRLGQSDPPRTVIGTIDLPDDSALVAGKDAMMALFADSLARPTFVHERQAGSRAARPVIKNKTRRG